MTFLHFAFPLEAQGRQQRFVHPHPDAMSSTEVPTSIVSITSMRSHLPADLLGSAPREPTLIKPLISAPIKCSLMGSESGLGTSDRRSSSHRKIILRTQKSTRSCKSRSHLACLISASFRQKIVSVAQHPGRVGETPPAPAHFREGRNPLAWCRTTCWETCEVRGPQGMPRAWVRCLSHRPWDELCKVSPVPEESRCWPSWAGSTCTLEAAPR